MAQTRNRKPIKKSIQWVIALALCLAALLTTVTVRALLAEQESIQETDSALQSVREELQTVQQENELLQKEYQQLQNQYNASIKSLGDNELALRIKTLYEQLDQIHIVAGMREVTGSGVVFTLNDRNKNDITAADDATSSIVHSYQVYRIINELKQAGAQAISVNGERLLPVSEVFCSGGTLKINGIAYMPPFVVQAIGNPDTLYNQILASETYSDIMYKKLTVSLSKETSLVIPKYNGNVDKRIDKLTKAEEIKHEE